MARNLLLRGATEGISMKKILLLVSMFICFIAFSQAPRSPEHKKAYEAQEDRENRLEWSREETEVKARKENSGS
jgi:hypothetical protein